MGFAEIVVIAIVGLIVIGPDKLPHTIKTGLTWIGRIKRLINDTRTEFEQQLGVDDIRREIHNEEVLASLKAIKAAKENTVAEVKGYAEKAHHDSKIFDDFDADDEGLFGDQQANHPPAPSAPSANNGHDMESLSKSASANTGEKLTIPTDDKAPQNT